MQPHLWKVGTTHPSRLTPQWRHHWVLTYPSLRSRRRTEITLISSPPVIHPVATDSCIGRAKSKFRPLNPSRSGSASEGLPERVLREEALSQLMLTTLFSYLADTSLVWLCLMDRDLQSLLFGHTPVLPLSNLTAYSTRLSTFLQPSWSSPYLSR